MTPADRVVPWLSEARAAWLEEVQAWLHTALARHRLAPSGEIECIRETPWAIVLRVPAAQDDVYLKASGPGGRHEPGLVAALAQRWRDRVPTPLAIDPQRGWMLLRDYGQTLRQKLGGADDLGRWQRLLPLYAEMQIASARELTPWLALGVPDRRLETLPALLAALLSNDAALAIGRPEGLQATERAAIRAQLPVFEACCQALAAMPYPAALDHGDLHAGNILVRDGTHWFCDWGDANLTHPFCSLLITCSLMGHALASSARQSRMARLRDAYLEPWSAYVPAHALRPCFAAAMWIAHVVRALDWQHMLQGASATARVEWQPYVAAWLRLWLQHRELLRADMQPRGRR